MNLGFDIDGVIAEFGKLLIDKTNARFDIKLYEDNLRHHNVADNTFSTDDRSNKKIIVYMSNLIFDPASYIDVEVSPKAPIVLKALKKRLHKIVIITARPPELEDITKEWLKVNGIVYDKLVLVGKQSKGPEIVKEKLDFYVDDCPEVLYNIKAYKHNFRKGLCVFSRPWNDNEPLDSTKFTRLLDWEALHRHLYINKR